MELGIIIILLVQHFIGDWLLQTRWMANNKSKNVWALSAHVLVVMGILFWFTAVIMNTWYPDMPILPVVLFVVVNGMAHFVTDAITSNITAHFHKQKDEGMFFKTIGLDQLIHYVTIFGTFALFFL